MHADPPQLVFLAWTVALVGAVVGLRFSLLPQSARLVVPFSGGLLVGVALLGLLPEIVEEIGYRKGLFLFAAGSLLLLVLDRKLPHNHRDGLATPYGFTAPLLIAAGVHAFFDGWGLVTVSNGGIAAIRLTFPLAVILHKGPEGLALGAIFRAASATRWAAFRLCVLAESATLVGGWAGVLLTGRLGSAWTNYPLAFTGGCFFYLGTHAVYEEWKALDDRRVMIRALLGVASAAVVQEGVRLLER